MTVGSGIIDSCGDNQVFGNGPSERADERDRQRRRLQSRRTAARRRAATAAAGRRRWRHRHRHRHRHRAAPKAAPVQCTVPKLVGLTLAKARTKLTKAHCKLGTVTRRTTRRATRVGKVLTQSRKAGTKRPAGTKVNVTVGRRPRAS